MKNENGATLVRTISTHSTWEDAVKEAVNHTDTTRNPRIVAVAIDFGRHIVGETISAYATRSPDDIMLTSYDYFIQTYPMVTENSRLVITPNTNSAFGIEIHWEKN